MDFLKTIWPTAFMVKEKDVKSLVIQLIILVVACAVAGVAIWILAQIPIVNLIVGIVGALVELYGLIGIVLCILNFFNVLK